MQNFLYIEYISSVCSDIKDNPKRFWSFIKSKRSSSTVPSNSITYTTIQTIATALNNYFQSVFVFNEPLEQCHVIPYSNVPNFRIPPLTYDEVRGKLKSLKRVMF